VETLETRKATMTDNCVRCNACLREVPACEIADPAAHNTGGDTICLRCHCECLEPAVVARHEERPVEGTGWYVYVGGEDAGGPFETEADALEAWRN
jgi:hypothetical protein